MNHWVSLGLFLLLCFTAAALGALATNSSLTTWYLTLRKPAWNPPDQIFGPVWTILYAAMAVAAWLVWGERARLAVGSALTLFALQLALNVLWTVLFFGWRKPAAALVEIMVLWAAILVTIILFARVRPVAAWLLVPYLGWVTFATILNGAIVRLNPRA